MRRETPTAVAARPSVLRSPRRLALAALGLLCTALAALGVVVPGLPTTVFLLAASLCFARSCPWLEERLLRNAFFRTSLGYAEGTIPMPRAAQVTSLILMWTMVSFSSVLLYRSTESVMLPLIVVAAAGIGTVMIVRRGA